MQEDGIKQVVENMADIIDDNQLTQEMSSQYFGQFQARSGSKPGMRKTGGTLKQLEEARRAKREQMEVSAQMTLVERERRRAEQEQ